MFPGVFTSFLFLYFLHFLKRWSAAKNIVTQVLLRRAVVVLLQAELLQIRVDGCDDEV